MTFCNVLRSIHYYSGFTYINTYLRIRSWWHLETNPRLQEEDIWHYFGVILVHKPVQPVSQTYPEDQDCPENSRIVPSTLLQPPVRSSIDSQSQFFRRLPSISRKCAAFVTTTPCVQFNRSPVPNISWRFPISTPVLEVSLIQTLATNRIFNFKIQ